MLKFSVDSSAQTVRPYLVDQNFAVPQHPPSLYNVAASVVFSILIPSELQYFNI